jgi:hypothetical protein
MPAQAGIQKLTPAGILKNVDSCFRRNDKNKMTAIDRSV